MEIQKQATLDSDEASIDMSSDTSTFTTVSTNSNKNLPKKSALIKKNESNAQFHADDTKTEELQIQSFRNMTLSHERLHPNPHLHNFSPFFMTDAELRDYEGRVSKYQTLKDRVDMQRHSEQQLRHSEQQYYIMQQLLEEQRDQLEIIRGQYTSRK